MTTPDRTANYTPKPKLLTVDDAKALDLPRMTELFTGHLNPGQLHFMKLLGFHKVKIERAEGMYYYDQNGRAILDFFGGFGSLAFGHNHPRIVAARQKFQDEQRHEICMAFMSQYAAALAKNLATIAPGDLDMVFLGIRVNRRIAEKFGKDKRERGLAWYAAMRSLQMRFMRLPKPQVKRGQYPS